MFMHHMEILFPIGTPHVRTAFGRYDSPKFYEEKTVAAIKSITIALLAFHVVSVSCKKSLPHYLRDTEGEFHHQSHHRDFSRDSTIRFEVYVITLWCCRDRADYSVVCVCIVLYTVRALYEGTLVARRTTAQTVSKCCWICSAQLAAFCLLLTILTVAARCYASSNATHPLVQFQPKPPTLSPIYNSNTQSSSLVLSRLFATTPHQLVQSDTSVILSNSKVLLYNQNFIRHHPRQRSRTKREFKSTAAAPINRINNLKTISDENPTFHKNFQVDLDANVLTLRTTKYNEPKASAHNHLGVALINRTGNGAPLHRSNITNSTQVNVQVESIEHQQNDGSFQDTAKEDLLKNTTQPMPPVHANDNETSGVVNEWSLILVVLVILTSAALGLVTCLLNHQEGTRGARGPNAPAISTNPHLVAESRTAAPMLSVVSAGAAAGMGGMDRLRGGRAARDLAAHRDRQVRLQAVHTDIAINLPPSIAMPDGEEHPFTTSRLHLRDAEQESEIYQKCIRPPPNRTVLESESPPPYRSSSAGVLASSSSSSSSDWSAGSAPLVVRCHSMSSTSKPLTTAATHPHMGQKTDFLQRTVKIFTGKKTQQPPPPAPTLPIVIVPSSSSSSRPRRTDTTRPKPPSGV